MSTFKQIQDEQRGWVKHNFPGRQPFDPLEGMVEELGELDDACEDRALVDTPSGPSDPKPSEANILDALADVLIYMTDYCSAMSIEMQAVYDKAMFERNYGAAPTRILSILGRLAHHDLKLRQKIRGDEMTHRDAIFQALVDITRFLEHTRETYFYDTITLHAIAWEVWTKVVSKRDWASQRAKPSTQ